MRSVLDPNVIISALLSPSGPSARLLRAWLDGHFELVVSPLLLAELERALGYPKLRKRISAEDAAALLDLLRRAASVASDSSDTPPVRSVDPGGDYLLALSWAESVALVSGDDHVLRLGKGFPIYSPAGFLNLLETGGDH